MFQVYLHGLPGGSGELAALGGAPKGWHCADWLSFGSVDALADDLRDRAAGHPVHLVGFSLGAFCALQLAARDPDLFAQVDLVSAAAPLELGNFLPRMAGRAVFAAAIAGGWRLRVLTAVQSALARHASGVMLRALFAGAAGADAPLSRDPKFRAELSQSWRAAAPGRCLSAYAAALRAYVLPWSDLLADVSCPVHLWHGDSDNWAPPEMAQALVRQLPNCTGLTLLSGLSHYSALAHVIATLPYRA